MYIYETFRIYSRNFALFRESVALIRREKKIMRKLTQWASVLRRCYTSYKTFVCA